MTNIKDIQNNSKKINADYNCLFLSRAHDRNKGKTQRTKRAENLQKHTHAAILPTDAFKLQISSQNSTLQVVTFLERQ